ncbi:MAG: hypothetical protein LBI45_05430 [Bacteroidales bacterium]|jgi:hypothetical protein|nr:hypothetical protein [Bacteroidales bacterium]
MWINKTTNASYGFTAPEVEEHSNQMIEVPFPAPPVIALAVIDSGKTKIKVKSPFTFIELGTTAIATEIEIEVGENVQPGAMITVQAKGTATEQVSFKDNGVVKAPAFANVAGKTKVQTLVYNGSAFVPTGVAFQID